MLDEDQLWKNLRDLYESAASHAAFEECLSRLGLGVRPEIERDLSAHLAVIRRQHDDIALLMQGQSVESQLGALQQAGKGAFLLNHLGEVTACNAIATDLIEGVGELRWVGRRVAFADRKTDLQVTALILKMMMASDRPGVAPLTLASSLTVDAVVGEARLEIALYPIATLVDEEARAETRLLLTIERKLWTPATLERSWAAITPAEQRVVRMIALGRSEKTIARLLGVSPNTVKTHRKNAYRKLGVSNRAAFASMSL
ncbi:LuxR C-terminal-related transcriptional regulator [Lacibacterium aquatile]|uniref:LuxR C-terminal-related transcriptional regulator n=1 Tax=Lacibacterium aquatile TaxID=1168082 RepID=A0ABW5DRL4_9PROT